MKKFKFENLVAIVAVVGIAVLCGSYLFGGDPVRLAVIMAAFTAAIVVSVLVMRSDSVWRGGVAALVSIALMGTLAINTKAALTLNTDNYNWSQIGISASSDRGDASESTVTADGTKITVVAKGWATGGSCSEDKSDAITITITNTSSAAITFNLSYDDNVTAVENADEGDRQLESQGWIKVSVTSGTGAGNDMTGVITITNVQTVFTGVQETTTFGNSTRGDVGTAYTATFGGTYTVDGTPITGTNALTNNSDHEYELVATPASGYTFAGWMSKNGGRLSTDANYTHIAPEGGNDVIWPMFVKSGSALYYIKGASAKVYYGFFDDAIAAAGTSGTIVLAQSGSMYGATTSTFNMGSGQTLLIPYDAGNLIIHTETKMVEGKYHSTLKYANMAWVCAQNDGQDLVRAGVFLPHENVTYTLTIPSGTTVNVASDGKFIIGGTIVSGIRSTAGVSCATSGAHSNVQLEGTLNVNGIMSVCGYILGNGQVNVPSGGKIYQPFTLMDFINGPYVKQAKDDMTWPFYRYAMINIQSNIHMESGASMQGYVSLYTGSILTVGERHNVAEFDLISSTGLVRLASGATLDISYDPNRYASDTDANHRDTGMYHRIGTTTMEFSGGMTFGSTSLVIEVSGEKHEVTTSGDHFVVPYNYNIVLNSGTYSLPNMLKLLPGATMTVNSGATLQVSSGGSLGVMAGLRDHRVYQASSDTSAWYSEHYPSTEVLQAAPFNSNGAGNLILNGGTLQVDSGASFGGLVQTTGTGTVVMKGTNTVEVRVGVLNSSVPVLGDVTGRGLYTLTAQVYGIDGTLITLESGDSGKTYTAVDNVKNTVTSYSYKVFTSSKSGTTTEMTQDLNADVIGSWVVEGTEVPDRTLDFSASNVRLGNNLDMMFAFPKFQPDADVLSNYYVQIVHTYANGRIDIKEIPFSQWRETTVNGTACYYVTYSGIGAKNMGDTIRAMVFYRTVDGNGKVTNVGVSKIWEDSIRAYADRMLTKYTSNDYSHLQTLLGDILNYGAACQLKFHYNTKYLANADFGNAGTTTNPTIDENLKNTTVGNDYWIGSNVIADSNTSFVIGFTTKFEEGMYFTYTFTNHWKKPVEQRVYFNELTPVYGADGTTVEYYYHGLANLRIADVDSNITFEVFYADGTSTGVKWTDSVLGYVSRMNERADDVYMALLKFANSAYKYLHEGKLVS